MIKRREIKKNPSNLEISLFVAILVWTTAYSLEYILTPVNY